MKWFYASMFYDVKVAVCFVANRLARGADKEGTRATCLPSRNFHNESSYILKFANWRNLALKNLKTSV